jgi:solute carrier family 66 (lysosomal lysine-arginine transporter), member 1
MAFLSLWLLGDLSNLIGSIWARLIPVIIVIAVYFCLADGVLIGQCLYYNIRSSRLERNRRRSSIEPSTPTTPLLGRRMSDESSQPIYRRRSSASLRDGYHERASRTEDSLVEIVGENEPGCNAWVNNPIKILAVCVIGSAGWVIAWWTGVWKPTPANQPGGDVNMALGAQVLGYFSAICYLK